jgi:hypothetical protein
MSFKKILPLLFLAALFILGSQYLILISGTADRDSNVSTPYISQYNTTRDINIVTISWVKIIAPILGFVIIVVAIKHFNKR